MNKQKKKKIIMVIVVALITLAITISYPAAKRFRNMMYTYSNPIEYGKEIIYPYIDEGDIRIADEIFQKKYEISRFDPVEIDELTWKEDPYADLYWRFNYYNLEPVRNLLFAWEKTNDPKYKDALIKITESFMEKGMDGPYSWDYHGAAFRAMTLINVREKLRQKNALPYDLDCKLLAALKIHGGFLANPDHFESDYNHGLDQAAALYLLAINYSNMPGADGWLKLSSDRLKEMLNGIIDDDGILVENSPYYHLYVLEKLLDINKYLKQNNLTIEGFSNEKIDKMVSYVVYMLEPDLSVPTIGASIGRQVGLSGMYKEIAASHPDLLYVLTQGAYGERPAKLNVQYPISGETIMRSGWGKRNDYVNQTQLIFDGGNYRTNHSDLDALSFNLFGKGIVLMPDSGLYSYEPGPYRSYFHGTRAHNTVIVDGKDQIAGSASANNKVTLGYFEEGNGYVYQSAQSNLYEGVSHERAITMIEDSTVIVIDNLASASDHTYEQMFHIFPGAKTSSDGLTFTAQGDKSEQSLSIRQFITDGVELHTVIGDKNKPDGVCSFEYGSIIACESVSYSQKGKDALYVTTISIGKNKADVQFDKNTEVLTVKTDKGEYTIKINKIEGKERVIEANKKIDTSEIYSDAQSNKYLNDLDGWKDDDGKNYGSNGESISIDRKEKSLKITAPSNGSYYNVVKNIHLDLSNQNIYFKIKIDNNLALLKGFDFYVSNDNWEKYAMFNVQSSSYDVDRSGEWLQFGVGKGELRKERLGNWLKNDPSFNWSKIDSIKFVAQSKLGQNATIKVKDFSLVHDQKEARAVIVFDDGWSSVMDAAASMNEYGMKGNVGVITSSVGKKNYLALDDIKNLQNKYGWDIASHSSLHKNAVNEYANSKNLSGLDTDIGDALQYLVKNNINSAPDWYIYPDGSTDGAVKNIIGKYYKFARATTNIPEVFPFAEPLEVGVFPVYSDRVTPIDVHNAVSDAIKYKQTLFLMFHKISKEAPSVFTEIPLKDLNTILKDINKQGIKVVTLSELDKENNIPETEFVVHDSIPEQLKLDVSPNRSMSDKIIHVILEPWEFLVDSGKRITQSLNFMQR